MADQTLQGLPLLMEQVDFLVLQHLNYIRNLENACKDRAAFVHKAHTDCNFGKLLYSQLFPPSSEYPDSVCILIKEIEQEHKKFHQLVGSIDALNPPKEEIDFTGVCMLVLKLYKLEEEVKKYLSQRV